MSEFESSNEFERREPSVVDRYYDYVDDAKGSAPAIVMALAELLDHLPVAINLPIETVFDAESYELSYQADPRATCESLALLPLRDIGPRLEQADCPVDELRAWYDDVVKRIVHQTKRDHNDTCLGYKHDYPTTMMCADSTECPQRILDDYLSKSAISPDFGERQYNLCPDRAKTMTIDKLAIGKKYALFTPAYAQTTLHMYEREYEEYITALVDAMIGNIDRSQYK